MPTYGYDPNGSPADWGATSTAGISSLRAYRPDPMTEHGWGYQIVYHVGRRLTGGNPSLSGAVYDSLDNLFEYSTAASVSTVMEDIAGGIRTVRDLRSCIKMREGKVYPLAILGTGQPYGHGMIAAARIVHDDEKFYFRDRSTQPPPDPMGYTTTETDGWMAIAVLYEANVAPDIPDSGFEPDIDETGVATVPFFEAFFRDDNEVVGIFGVGEADTMSQYQVQIGQGTSGSSVWFDSQWVNATDTEQDDRKFHYTYDGTPLTGGGWRWRCRVRDDYSASSGWSQWVPFTVGGGTVTIPSPAPTGKQTTRNPSPFQFHWAHSAALSTNAVKVRIKSGNTVIRESGWISTTVANGGNGSITWAATGFTVALPIGMVGSYSIQGRATDNGTTDYSADSPFSVDAAPGYPDQQYPGGNTVNELPEFRTYVTDPDDTAASLTVTLRLYGATGTFLFSRTMVHVGNNYFSYQAVGGDGLVSGTTYQWDNYAYDGTFYSGGTTVAPAQGILTTETFTYVALTTPALTYPIAQQIISDTRPRFTWSFSGTQTKYRVTAWDPVVVDSTIPGSTDSLIERYDSGIITSANRYDDMPDSAEELPNTTLTRWQVTVWDNLGNVVTSSPQDFNVDLDDVPTVAWITAAEHNVAGEDVATAVRISWAPTAYEDHYFQHYIVHRRADRDTVFDVDDPYGSKVQRVAKITDPAQTSMIDHPAFGIRYFYSVRQVIQLNGQTYTGDSITAEVMIDFDGVVICDARHCADKRALFQGREDREIENEGHSTYRAAWNDAKPTKFRTRYWTRNVDTEFIVYSTDPTVIENTLLDVDRMHKDGGPLLYRDGRGLILLGEIDDNPRKIDPPAGGLRRVALTFKQTAAKFLT